MRESAWDAWKARGIACAHLTGRGPFLIESFLIPLTGRIQSATGKNELVLFVDSMRFICLCFVARVRCNYEPGRSEDAGGAATK